MDKKDHRDWLKYRKMPRDPKQSLQRTGLAGITLSTSLALRSFMDLTRGESGMFVMRNSHGSPDGQMPPFTHSARSSSSDEKHATTASPSSSQTVTRRALAMAALRDPGNKKKRRRKKTKKETPHKRDMRRKWHRGLEPQGDDEGAKVVVCFPFFSSHSQISFHMPQNMYCLHSFLLIHPCVSGIFELPKTHPWKGARGEWMDFAADFGSGPHSASTLSFFARFFFLIRSLSAMDAFLGAAPKKAARPPLEKPWVEK
jgi:hypothetical protein